MSKFCFAGSPTCCPSKQMGCAVKVTFRAQAVPGD